MIELRDRKEQDGRETRGLTTDRVAAPEAFGEEDFQEVVVALGEAVADAEG